MDPLDAQANNDGINTDTDPANEQAPSGVQERIDELVGKFRGLERTVAEKDQTITQLTGRILELTNQRQAPAADPLDAVLKDIDPDDARRVDALVARRLQPLEQRIAQLTGQLQETQARGALAGVQDPAVRQEAQKLIAGWQKKGVYGSVATDEDAVLMAEALVARQRGASGRSPEAERQAFNRGEQPLSGVRALPTGQNGRKARVDLSGLDADQLAARLRANPELEDQLDIEL